MRPGRRGVTVLELIVVVFILAILFGLLLPPMSSKCPAGPRVQCVNNLHQVALAVFMYSEQHGSFPPAYLPDASGRPAHSWRVLILPYLDQQALYDAYNFGQPWDGPQNRALLDQMPSIYCCPTATVPSGHTSYVALVGTETVFPGARCVRPDQVKDGMEYTLMLAETTTVRVPWTAPVDLDVDRMSLTINDPQQPGIGGSHAGVASVAMADGHVRSVSPTSLPPAVLRAMLTIDGGETIDPSSLSP